MHTADSNFDIVIVMVYIACTTGRKYMDGLSQITTSTLSIVLATIVALLHRKTRTNMLGEGEESGAIIMAE